MFGTRKLRDLLSKYTRVKHRGRDENKETCNTHVRKEKREGEGNSERKRADGESGNGSCRKLFTGNCEEGSFPSRSSV